MRKFRMLAAAGLLVAGLALPALADDNDMPMWSMGHMMGEGWMGMGPGAMMLDHIDGRLAFLKTELKITEAQTPAWDALAKAVKDSATRRKAAMETMFQGGLDKRTLLERVDIQEAMMTSRLDEIRTIKAALGTLYAQLSDEQKKAADTTMFPMIGMGPGMMHARRGWWGGPE